MYFNNTLPTIAAIENTFFQATLDQYLQLVHNSHRGSAVLCPLCQFNLPEV